MAVQLVTDEGNALLTYERGGRCLTKGCRLQKCAMCEHHTEALWLASRETHRIHDDRVVPCEYAICAHCWGKWLIKDDPIAHPGLTHELSSSAI